MHLPEGTLLCGGKYEIVRYISSGGFGCTYEARNTAFRNRTVTVAIKEFFVKDFCNRDAATNNVVVGTNSREALVEKLKSKFMDEAEALYALNHPNIVRVTDLFEDKNTVYYVMDYIEGGSLSGIISEKGRLAEKEALGYILQIADALKYVHSHNCLHLDVKPQNIMIDNSGKATLIDFGVSKQYDEANGENTSTLMGSTPGYAPIEQTGACMAKFYPASDIYALGATLYKALTGITPPPASLIASGERELDPLPATVSAAVQRAVEASMQLNRSKRPQSIGEFLRLVESGESKDESGKMKDATGIFGNASVAKEQESIFGNASSDGSSAASQDVMPLGSQKAGVAKEQESIFGNASSDGSSAASQNVMPLGSQKAGVAKEQESIFGNASSDRSSAASQDVMPLGSQKASVTKVESEETKIASDAASLSMGTGQNAANGNAAADEQEDIAVEVVETPSVTPEPAPRPQPEENQKKSKWFWKIILLAVICGALGGFMFLGGGSDDAVIKDSANKKDTIKNKSANKKDTIKNKKDIVAENTINGHEYVDLGLSVKWATCNVGASKPEEYGNHYAWGETSTKEDYSWSTYKWCNGSYDKITKYCSNSSYGRVDNKRKLELSDDVARKQWGSTWRLPTKVEFEELLNENNCTWTWTTQNGIKGYKVTSKKNGNSIFLPAAGSYVGTSLIFQGSYGYYWSSTPHENDSYRACSLDFYSGYHGTSWDYRDNGPSVRPVSK